MGVLSAPSTPTQSHVLSGIIVTISVLSAIGAGWIILSFLVSHILTRNRLWYERALAVQAIEKLSLLVDLVS